ncbi:DUF4221 family protein [Cyclobacterium xiamenense]|uniref:DUF4221 family protein n=1 Tax=Cyclobacterium xiamenense TaxID=1297121 RepID=UPI0012B71CFC|nr:DUF4221 family protein [Cyclobacterium xiamenense]
MKSPVLVCSLLILLGCSEKKSEPAAPVDFLLTQDTVLIDPQGSIINLKYGLTHPELSADGNYLYHYNYGEARFDKVNLETLELERTLQYEKEGPDGMGGYIGGYALTGNDQVMVWSNRLNALFDQEGKKVRDLKLTRIASEIEGPEIFPIRLMEHPSDPNTFYGLYGKWLDHQFFLIRFDLETESYEKIPLPETRKLNDYRMEIEHEGKPAGGFSPKPIAHAIQDEKIVITNGAFNEAYVYDIRLDSLYLKTWESQLTPNQNEYKLPKTVELLQAEEHYMKFNESIYFLPPKWDPVSQRYIRLSFTTQFSENLDEYGEAIETGAEVYLTVLDKDLTMLGETYLEQYPKNPRQHFFADNKIWLYENMDDELGFVRIRLD